MVYPTIIPLFTVFHRYLIVPNWWRISSIQHTTGLIILLYSDYSAEVALCNIIFLMYSNVFVGPWFLMSCGTPSFTACHVCHVSVSTGPRWPAVKCQVLRMHPPARLYVSLGRFGHGMPWGDLRQSKMGYDGHDKYLGLELSKMGYDGILESNDGICRYPMIIDTEDISEKKTRVMG